MKIFHDSRKSEYREPFGAVEILTKVRLSLRIEYEASEEHVEGVQVRYFRDEIGEVLKDMDFA